MYSESEELTLSSGLETVDKKDHTTSIIWKWFGYLESDEAQIKTVCNICHWAVPTKMEAQQIFSIT